MFYGLFEWKKKAGHVLCKIVSEYYDFFFAEIFFTQQFYYISKVNRAREKGN